VLRSTASTPKSSPRSIAGWPVQRLAHDALDQVRRAEVRATTTDAERRRLKHTRWALQKNPWNLTQPERAKLADLQRSNRRIYRAYLLKESLVDVLDRRQVHVAETKPREWRGWALRSRLDPFRRVARTITEHLGWHCRLPPLAALERTHRRHQRQDPHDYPSRLRLPQRHQSHSAHQALLFRR
jgi:hypothetical protein